MKLASPVPAYSGIKIIERACNSPSNGLRLGRGEAERLSAGLLG